MGKVKKTAVVAPVEAVPAPKVAATKKRRVTKSKYRPYFNRICKELNIPRLRADAVEIVEVAFDHTVNQLISQAEAMVGQNKTYSRKCAVLGFIGHAERVGAPNATTKKILNQSEKALGLLLTEKSE